QRRSLSRAHDQALPIQRDGRGAWHLAAGRRNGAPLSLRGGERAADHGQETIGAQELGPQADEAAWAEAGTRRGGAQARHPLGEDLERWNPLRRRACVTAAGLCEEEQDER